MSNQEILAPLTIEGQITDVPPLLTLRRSTSEVETKTPISPSNAGIPGMNNLQNSILAFCLRFKDLSEQDRAKISSKLTSSLGEGIELIKWEGLEQDVTREMIDNYIFSFFKSTLKSS